MAPEQLGGGGAEPTTATDVYALGAALLFAASVTVTAAPARTQPQSQTPYPGGPGGAPGFPGPPPTPGQPPRLWVVPASGAPGTAFVLDGANWPPQVPVTIVLDTGAVARTVPVTARDGSLVLSLTTADLGLLPDPLRPGGYRITAVSGPFQIPADFTVLPR